jgi:hypothetical protein
LIAASDPATAHILRLKRSLHKLGNRPDYDRARRDAVQFIEKIL